MTTIPLAVAEAARATPSAVAVLDGDVAVTYADLIRRASRVGAALSASGVGPGDTVVIDRERGATAIVLALGAMTAGAAYTALRRDGSEHVERRLAALRPTTVLDAEPDGADGGEQSLPADGDAVAYVVFTSGTTGEPKPVRVPHRAVLRLLGDDRLGLVAGRRMAHTAPLEFDASVYEVWGALAAGMTVVVVPSGEVADPHALARTLRTVDVAWLTASLFALVAQHEPSAFDGLDRIVAGGEQLDLPSVNAVAGRTVVVNGYGPTENGVFTLLHEMHGPVDEVAVGTPVHGTRVAVQADADGTGELVAFGAGLALEYLGAPGRGFVDIDGERAYKTGDRVRTRDDGVYVFVGRNDRQVKMLGHRIELGALEAAYLGAGATAARAVRLADGGLGVVYVGDPEQARVRSALPSWSLPAVAVPVDRIPLLPNGKTDARRVAEIADASSVVTIGDSPDAGAAAATGVRGAIGQAVEAVTGRALDPEVDDLFGHGIDSIALWRVLMTLNERFGTVLTLLDVFASPTVTTIERLLTDAALAPSETLGTE
jgi:acyl-coenzyme A synthetase/AMP-(fatty) acid ligase/aryl carrier-like protein